MTIVYLAASGLGLAWAAQVAAIAGAGCYFAVTSRQRKDA
jgi:hypothetical protein